MEPILRSLAEWGSASSSSFEPARWLPGRHLQTIVPALLPAGELRGPEETVVVSVAENASLRIETSRPPGPARGTLILVHGVGGSSRSSYVRRMARMAHAEGWTTVRVNCRNCGGSEALSRTLYNAGQSDDFGPVLAHLDAAGYARPFALVGFSLGGAMALRYAGRSGDSCLADCVAAVNPPVDLAACCKALERPDNALYHAHFTISLCRLLRRVQRIRPVPGPDPAYRRVRTLRRLDGWYTAPDAGYASAEEYYREASAAPYLTGIRVLTLVLVSENDPVIPPEIFDPIRRHRSSRLRFLSTAQGGHLGFWSTRSPRFWLGGAILESLAGVTGF